MHRILFLAFLIVSSLSTIAQNSVLYGERDTVRNHLALFYDKEGTIYPDYFISNASLEKNGASLRQWYSNNTDQFLAIAQKYRCCFAECSAASIETLSDSITAVNSRRINSTKAQYGSATFLVHGFRKPFVPSNGDYTSVRDFQIMEDNVSLLGNRSECFVEVYWDALYGRKFSASIKENRLLFALFEQAQANALSVGKNFRQILSQTSFDTINIYSHSLGAKVVAQALFNVAECTAPTPTNRCINICMVAPAISGDEIFMNYFSRNTSLNYRLHDNYRLAIAYNIHDFVLKKKDNKLGWFGPGPYKHGNTSLGCNYRKSIVKLVDYFSQHYPYSPVTAFNLSVVGKCHHVRCYFAKDYLTDAVHYLKE